MVMSNRFWVLCAASAAALTAAASGCNDSDNTEICVGPTCPQYDGVGGERNLFRRGDPQTSSDTAGSAGASGESGMAGSAGSGAELPEVESPDASTAPPDGGTPPSPVCQIAFSNPVLGDAGDLTVDGTSDADGEACGSEFILPVTLTSNADSVTLFVNDTPLSTQDVVEGGISFDAVLGNRGSTPNVLRAEATMADNSTCSVTFSSDILVDCAGPSCSITAPVANADGYLNVTQDIGGADGLQTDIVVGTEPENVGQSVRLEIDGAFDTVPDEQVLLDTDSGSATFANITLAEGPRAVRAECSDALGLKTLSAPAAFDVDVTPCAISITSLAGGANPITPGSDQDSGAAGIQVLANGTITGGDCKTLRIGVCDGAVTPLPLTLPLDGSFSLPVTLVGSTGSLDICGVVEDFAGNVSSQGQITVNLRLDAPQVAIVSPVANTRYNRLGTAGALADGNALNMTCEAAVVVNCTELGQNVDLLADGSPIGQATCVAQPSLPGPFLGQATFAQASLPTKNDGSASLLTAEQAATGFPTTVSASVSIQADCEPPSCSLVNPNSGLAFLNATLDSDPASGLQIDFDVRSDPESLGQNVGLIIDGGSSGALSAALLAQSGGAQATFADVSLSEGPRTAQAQCVDPAGNVQLSASQGWTVDSVPCSANALVIAGGVTPIIPANDSNLGAPGLQATVSGQATGGDCTTARVGLCNSLSGGLTALSGDQSFSLLELTLASSTTAQDVCVEVTDTAGNVGQGQIQVAVRVSPPVVSIQSPANGSHFNIGTTCNTAVVANCSDVGVPVQLLVDGVPTDTGACSGAHEVTLNASLASKNDGSTTTLSVRQTADNMTSLDASIDVQADCQAPAPTFTGFNCGDQLALAGDDVDSGTPGLQFPVSVLNDGASTVTLTVTRGASSADTTITGNTISTDFSAADLGGIGSIFLSACATDAQGNPGCSVGCALTIAAEPSISITNPLPGVLFNSASADCDGVTAGLQIAVQGLTSAPDGSAVQVGLGAGTASNVSASGGAFTACIQPPDGNTQTLTASVTDSATTLSGSASIQISVDTTGPNAIATLARDDIAGDNGVVVRRKGDLRLKWTSILDSDGDRLSAYRLRCAASAITNEGQWTAATVFPVTTFPPAAAGITEIEAFTHIDKPGQTRFCAMRGEDQSGQLSALPTNLTLTNPFHTQEYAITDDAVGGNALLVAVEPLGDIDGDSIADFAYGAQNQGVQVFLGKADFDISLVDVKNPDFTIRNTGAALPSSSFGFEVAGLGDINGDAHDDFAIGAANDNKVFVFFGRASNSWLDINLATFAPCPADLCITGVGVGGAGNFGFDISSANFDGAGTVDLIISARTAQSTQANAGRVYVLLGGAQLATPGTTITLPTDNPNGFIINPPASRTFFGVSLAAVRGTLGVDDLVIGANGSTTATANRVAGRAHLGTGLTTINAAGEFENGPVGNYGNPIRAIGDFNGDGRGDLALERNGNLGGIVNVYLGLAGGGFNNLAGNLLTFSNELFPGFDDNHGRHLAQGFHSTLGPMLPGAPAAALGDLDQDGITELLTGATTADVPAGGKGIASLFYGSAGATGRSRTSADFTYTPQNTQVVPNFVGDINHDNFPDFALLDSGTGANVLFLLY